MGYDIDICHFIIKDNNAYRHETVTETYLSYNWSDLADICLDHFRINDKCNCDKTPLWYIRDDCHARRGDDIRNRTQKALMLLSQYDIVPGVPDMSNSSWGWGLCRRNGNEIQKKLPIIDRLGVFAYHLKRFHDIAANYPNCFFIADCDENDCEYIILPNDVLIPCNNQDGDNNDDCDDCETLHHGPITYYRHPFKGNFRVDSFLTAMEIYGLISATDGPDAKLWFDLAMKMHDAPGKK